VLHTAAYWLMLAVREAIPKARDLAIAEFATLRLRLIKPPVSSKPPAACGSPSPPHVQKPICSAACRVRSSCSDRESWHRPRSSVPFSPTHSQKSRFATR
jgi:hypothetical protein